MVCINIFHTSHRCESVYGSGGFGSERLGDLSCVELEIGIECLEVRGKLLTVWCNSKF